MNKRRLVSLLACAIVLGGLAALLLNNPFRRDAWDVNADAMKESLAQENPAVIENLAEFTPFDWDTLIAFAPDTDAKEVYAVVGYEWDHIDKTVKKGMEQVVFLRKGEVVCHLYGYPENMHLGFDFGSFPGSYRTLKASDALCFDVTRSAQGVWYLHYRIPGKAASVW